jgi:UPF0176 protein
MDTPKQTDKLVVAALYQFTEIYDLPQKQSELLSICRSRNVRGTLILATEGINGTISGRGHHIKTVIQHIIDWPEIAELDVKYSSSTDQNFNRMKVKIREEIVTMGVSRVNAKKDAGKHVEAKDWNKLINREDIALIDVRNKFEIEVGRFKGSIGPNTDSFSDFPDWVTQHSTELAAKPAIAMYCTGGIRCEKASAYMKSMGFGKIYHLKGGILKYLEEIAASESLWEGECFVFDDRVSLTHGLEEGAYTLCYGCQDPLSEQDRESQFFEEGVTCPKCYNVLSDSKKARSRERQKQILIARSRGSNHLGSTANHKDYN